jgi:diketogulonate reductase-like aldo/keto reductase
MTATEQILATLNNGVQIPALGFGVFQTSPEDTIAAVTTALDDGYRLIDTAAAYGNEQEVGEAIRRSGIGRSEIFIETKLWISDYGTENAQIGFDASLRRLGMDYVDVYLLHQPGPGAALHLGEGRSALPKSVTPSRIAQNLDVFDFTLEPAELTAIDALDTGLRGGLDPELLNTRTFPKTVDNS